MRVKGVCGTEWKVKGLRKENLINTDNHLVITTGKGRGERRRQRGDKWWWKEIWLGAEHTIQYTDDVL